VDQVLLEKIRRCAIVSVVSNDDLMDRLVLKGGTAIDLVYQISGRASIDVDFSMQDKFHDDELSDVMSIIKSALEETFKQEGLCVFDITLDEKPDKISAEYKDFWGGYKIGFKVIPYDFYNPNSANIDTLRRNATVVGQNQKRIFEIEISKFEYCGAKVSMEIDGYTVYVYTTEMLVLEKIRAICQQNPEYKGIIKTFRATARARDFYDIYILLEHSPKNLNAKETKELLKAIFEAKKVPLDYIYKVKNDREFHRTDYASLKDTVKIGIQLEEFDFYFDYVVAKLESIEL